MKNKKKWFAILFAICLISYCSYNRKPKPTLGVTYFDIPMLMNKNIEEAIKLIGFYTEFDKGIVQLTSAGFIFENNGWELFIGLDSVTRKIDGISLSQNSNNYEIIEFNNSNIDDFLRIGNLDKTSKAYNLTLSEPSGLFPEDEPKVHRIYDKFNNIVLLNIVRKTPTMIYDIPNLIGKKIDYVRLQLGKNLKSNEEDKKDREGYITYKKNGYTLIVNFNTMNKIISSFKIVADEGGFENAKDILSVGNLDNASPKYLCVVGSSGNMYNSVSIYPN